jgi:hypothetical protein
MNRYVDEYIAFEYPEDGLLHVAAPGNCCISKGDRLISVIVIDKLMWEFYRLQSREEQERRPRFGTDPPGRVTTVCATPYSRLGFIGDAFWGTMSDTHGKLLDKSVSLLLVRGEKYLYLDVRDWDDFGEDVLTDFLRSVAFPGEDAYAAARQRGARHERKTPLNGLELPSFAKLGRSSAREKAVFNVQYEGGGVTEPQTQALRLLVKNEKTVFREASKRILQYYGKGVRPSFGAVVDAFPWCKKASSLFPPMTTVGQINRKIKLSGIVVHEPRKDGTVPIGLRFHCQWDEEHGLGVRVVGQEIEAVGMDEVALCADVPGWQGET